jgi:leader peptidase (prepilin peptidase)/N-methyltransferase
VADLPLELLLSPWALAAFGLAVGSFLNVVVYRLPASELRDWWRFDIADYALADGRAWKALLGPKVAPPPQLKAASDAIAGALDGLPLQTLVKPRSRCPHCGHVLRWYENIPVVSWLALRARCSSCKAAISWRYPLVEIATAAAFATHAVQHGASALTVVLCIASALLIVMALVDLDTTLLPESLTIPLIALGLLAALARWTPVSVAESAIGLLLGYGLLWSLGFIWKVALHRPNAMAEGDMKMLGGLGALLGWKLIPGLLLVSAGVGAVVGIAMMMFGGLKRETPIPFGPYLALAGLVGVFAPDTLLGFGDALDTLLR